MHAVHLLAPPGNKMKPILKNEKIALLIIFVFLVVISVPNFAISLRRARDQTRRDDLGMMQKALDMYLADFGVFPLSSSDNKLLACIKPGDKVEIDKNGKLVADFIPCQWGVDSIRDLTPGSTKVYVDLLPNDPHALKGVNYQYFSNGSMYQIFTAFEGKDEAEYDNNIAARNLMCGNKICNVGRYYHCSTEKTLAVCEAELLRKK